MKKREKHVCSLALAKTNIHTSRRNVDDFYLHLRYHTHDSTFLYSSTPKKKGVNQRLSIKVKKASLERKRQHGFLVVVAVVGTHTNTHSQTCCTKEKHYCSWWKAHPYPPQTEERHTKKKREGPRGSLLRYQGDVKVFVVEQQLSLGRRGDFVRLV
jgi:hypothetical protein